RVCGQGLFYRCQEGLARQGWKPPVVAHRRLETLIDQRTEKKFQQLMTGNPYWLAGVKAMRAGVSQFDSSQTRGVRGIMPACHERLQISLAVRARPTLVSRMTSTRHRMNAPRR